MHMDSDTKRGEKSRGAPFWGSNNNILLISLKLLKPKRLLRYNTTKMLSGVSEPDCEKDRLLIEQSLVFCVFARLLARDEVAPR